MTFSPIMRFVWAFTVNPENIRNKSAEKIQRHIDTINSCKPSKPIKY